MGTEISGVADSGAAIGTGGPFNDEAAARGLLASASSVTLSGRTQLETKMAGINQRFATLTQVDAKVMMRWFSALLQTYFQHTMHWGGIAAYNGLVLCIAHMNYWLFSA